jgi:thiamine-phosphate pyrophosphorylase
MPPSALRLPAVCLVTDRRLLTPDARTTADEIANLEAFVDEAIGAGVDMVQVRERDLDAAVLRSLVARIMSRAAGGATCVLVNDRADVAIAAGAAGVHLRADGAPVDRARSLGPPGWIVGRSVHSAAEVDASQAADYLFFGTVFPSATKLAGAAAPHGLAALGDAVRRSRVPVLAIGGIDATSARRCREAGAAGVAAIGVFLPSGRAPGARGPADAVRELKAAVGAAPRDPLQ